MKSIMEEASTIAKAIEKGWKQAGQPKEFSVKVFEEPETSFFGFFTKKPAKIALFFEDKSPARAQHQPSKKQHTPTHAQSARPSRTPAAQPQRQQRTERTERPQASPEKQQARVLPESSGQPWSDAMLSTTKEWVDNLLQSLSKSSVQYTIQPKNYYLKVTFQEPLLQTTENDRQLFRNSSYLLMQALRNACKKSLRGYKIIISGPGTERATTK